MVGSASPFAPSMVRSLPPPPSGSGVWAPFRSSMTDESTVTWSASIIHWLTSTKDDLGAGPARASTGAAEGEGPYYEMH